MADLSNPCQVAQRAPGRLPERQSKLAQETVAGPAGAGMAPGTVDGRGQVRAVEIDASLSRPFQSPS
jgi:DNA-binding protein YbaB